MMDQPAAPTERPTKASEPEVVVEPREKRAEPVNEPKGGRAMATGTSRAAKPAEPGVYTYKGKEPTWHPILNLIQPGKNDYSDEILADRLQALADLVEAGEMKKS